VKTGTTFEKQVKPARSSPTRLIASLETCLIVLGLLCMFFILPRSLHGDGTIRYHDLTTFLQHGIVASSTTTYSLVGPFFALPLLVLGDMLGHPVAWILVYNYLLFVLGLLLIWLLWRNALDRSFLRKFLLILVTASMFASNLFSFYGEVFSALSVGIGIIVVVKQRSSATSGWVALILGVVNTPAMAIGFCLVVVKHLVTTMRIRTLWAIVVLAILILGESWLRRGSPLANGYADNKGGPTVMPYSGVPGFSYPFFFGLISILFSFGKGLVFFTPGCLLPVRKTLVKWQERWNVNLYQVYVLWLSFLVGMILVYARWWSWYGGLYWGPRFFLFASIPASLALAIRVHDRETTWWVNLVTCLVLCLSTWVGICAALFQGSAYISTCTAHQYALEAFCHYVPEFSVLWHPFVVHPHLDQKLYLLYLLIVFVYFLVPLLYTLSQQKVIFLASLKHIDWRAIRY
jgi:hypothetical protein